METRPASLPEFNPFGHQAKATPVLGPGRLVAKLGYSTIAFQFMPEKFTLGQLQAVYETISAETIDKRNFRKWVLGLGRIEATGEERRDGQHRPAKLYRQRFPGKVENIR